MAPSPGAGLRLNLLLLALFTGFLACGYLAWERRDPWHVVATLSGRLPPQDSPVPYVFDAGEGTLRFPDTGELYQLPPEFRGNVEIMKFAPSRASFQFRTDEPGGIRVRCWNMDANREVPIPDEAQRSWRLSESGTRILIEDVQPGMPRHFQVLGLDGSVLHERGLPALDDRSSDAQHEFSAEGRFLIVTFADSRRVHLTRIYDMESQESWPFPDRFAALSEEGVVWLKDAGSVIERDFSETLRAVRFPSGQELWSAVVPEGVSTTVYLGRDRLAVGVAHAPSKFVVFDAQSGRRLFTLDGEGFQERPLQLREAGSSTYLEWGGTYWSFETGRKLSYEAATSGYWFFDDGRRALVDLRCGCQAGVVDAETGERLFLFGSGPRSTGSLHVRPVGNRVLSSEVGAGTSKGTLQLWERRHPEGWKGHLLRPELLLAIVLGAAILALWANRPGPERVHD